MRRAARRFAWGLLLMLLLLALAVTWLVTTESGLRWGFAQARPLLPEGVEIGAANGRLIGPLAIEDVVVETGAATVRLQRLALDWSPGTLLAGLLRVEYLHADDIEVEVHPAGDGTRGAAPAPPSTLQLPLTVQVQEARIRSLRIHGDGIESLTVDRADASAVALRAGLTIDRLRAEGPRFRLSGGLVLGGVAPFPLDGHLQWRVMPGEPVAPLAGTLGLGGSLFRLDGDLRLNEPQSVRIEGSLQPFEQPLPWRLHVRGERLSPRQWLATAPDHPFDIDLQADGRDAAATVEGSVRLSLAPAGPLKADVRAYLTAGGADLQRLDLSREAGPGALGAEGRVDWDGDSPSFDLALEWQDLQWPLDGAEPQFASGAGTARVEGTPAEYAVEFDGELQAGDLPPGRWRGDLEGTPDGLQRIDLEGDWLGGRIRADGSVGWDQGLDARGRLEADGLEPGRLDSRFSGTLNLAVDGRFRQPGTGSASGRVTLQRLAGTLNDITLEGEGQAWFDGNEWRVPQLRIAAGETRASLQGTVGDSLDLVAELVAPDLGAWLPDAAGSIEAEARMTGELQAPAIELKARADELRYREHRLRSARLEAGIERFGRGGSSLVLELTELSGPRQRGDEERVLVHHAGLEIAGTRASHVLGLAVDAPAGAVALRADGSESNGGWEGRLQGLTVTPAGHPAWQLAEGRAIRIGADGLDAGRNCLERGRSRLCAAGTLGSAGDWRAQWELDGLEADELVRLWRDDLRAEGSLSSEGELRGRDGVAAGTVRVELSRGRLQRGLDEEWIELLRWQRSSAEIGVRPDRFRVDLEAPLEPAGRIEAGVHLPRNRGGELSGSIVADMHQLEWLPLLVPEIGSTGGRAQLDLALAGSESAPELQGQLELIDGTVSIPRLGVVWRQLQVGLRTDNREIRLQASGRSGDGMLEADAVLNREAGAWQIRGTLAGEQFTAVDTAEARVVVTPRLEWSYEQRRVTVEGEVSVPAARLEPRDLAGAVSASPDARIVGTEVRRQEPPLQIAADVAVTLGEEVHFDGFGLSGRLEGGLRVRQRPGELSTGAGEVRVVDGEYEAYRQKLTIERGVLLFDGPVDDPGLDIRAVRRPRDVLVGVNVRGTLREPRLSLFSEPPMQESQILSYLVLGIPMNETGEDDRSSLAAAAAAASFAGGEWLARQIGAEFGITDVQVDADDTGEAALVLGRYLTPRLYASYGIGLFENVNTLRLRYHLTRNWSLEGKSGVESSGDLLFSIER